MNVVRVLVPMSCCDSAATYLIDALGGEEKTREVVGGTKWWQVRGLQGCVYLKQSAFTGIDVDATNQG